MVLAVGADSVRPVRGGTAAPTARDRIPEAAWVAPVPGPVTSGFRTPARPTHDGVDFLVPRHTAVVAATTGVVVRVRCHARRPDSGPYPCDVDGDPDIRGCGWFVELGHAGRVVTRYCHLVRRPDLAEGDLVVVGQVIGHIGSSGNSSQPHLHFEVHTDEPVTKANAVDPVPFLRARNVRVRT